MTVLKVNPALAEGSRAVGTIAMCARDDVKSLTAISWLMSDYGFLAPDEYVGRFIITGNMLTMQRNECVHRMEGDWILFIDDDMTWQPKHIAQIVESQRRTGADVVGGLCFQRTAPYQPTLYRVNRDGTGYTYTERWTPGDVIDVDATGMAFCLITAEALSKIVRHETGDPDASYPPYGERSSLKWRPQFFQMGQFGEDFSFCRSAKAAGCRIVVDTGIEIGHIGDHVVTRETFLREVFFRHDAAGDAKRAAVAGMDVEVMARREALEILEAMMADEVRR